MKTIQSISTFFCFFALSFSLCGQSVQSDKLSVVLSAIKGTAGRPDTLTLTPTKSRVSLGEINIIGDHPRFFTIVSRPAYATENQPGKIIIAFTPEENFIGIAHATLVIKKVRISIPLTGLSTKGLEGENEAPLSQIVDALGYAINPGWTTLANNLLPARQGEELEPAYFQKSDPSKPVTMHPVARYSPDFPVNFGIYTNAANGPVHHQLGILATAKKFPQHQMLFPDFSPEAEAFDPGEKTFGLYAISPSHTVYSDDIWNILFHPTHAAHAMRIYPVRNSSGVVKDEFLVCMEEAANGDYNDYVFLIKNIKPVFISGAFESLYNGQDLQGWYTWLQSEGKNSDPGKIFAVEGDGTLHISGKELGYVMSAKTFGNYHFKLQFKWGDDRWPPRENSKRDSGICYNIPADESDKIWPESVECQIQEGDVGDFWLLGYSTIQVDGKQNPPMLHSQIVKKRDAEKPKGEWNTVEVISFNGKCAHIVNGVVVNYGENATLTGGRILLQSEYAEVYYRNMTIRKLDN